MAEKLVTQVRQDEDPKEAEARAAAQRAELERKREKEREAKEEKEPPPSFCSRLFCCFCRRSQRAPSPPKPVAGGSDPVPVEPAKAEPEKKWLLGPPKPEHKGRKTLVLDLDETLVHSSFTPVPGADYVISIELEGVVYKVYVLKRPGVDEFLEAVATKFEVVVFTASLEQYANPVLDHLDPKGFCTYRLFRESCVQHYGSYVKDLSLLGRELKHTLILDNSHFSYLFQPDNAIPITSWFNDKSDRELLELIPFLNTTIAEADDVSRVIVERKQWAMEHAGEAVEEDDGGGGGGEEEDDGSGGGGGGGGSGSGGSGGG